MHILSSTVEFTFHYLKMHMQVFSSTWLLLGYVPTGVCNSWIPRLCELTLQPEADHVTLESNFYRTLYSADLVVGFALLVTSLIISEAAQLVGVCTFVLLREDSLLVIHDMIHTSFQDRHRNPIFWLKLPTRLHQRKQLLCYVRAAKEMNLALNKSSARQLFFSPLEKLSDSRVKLSRVFDRACWETGLRMQNPPPSLCLSLPRVYQILWSRWN